MKHVDNSQSKKKNNYIYLILSLKLSAQTTSTFEKSVLYYELFYKFIQLLVSPDIQFLLGTGSGVPLLAFLHRFYVLK